MERRRKLLAKERNERAVRDHCVCGIGGVGEGERGGCEGGRCPGTGSSRSQGRVWVQMRGVYGERLGERQGRWKE